MRSFRNFLALSGAVTLAACGGDTRPTTVGSVAAPAGTPTPTHSFVTPTEAKTYEGVGAVQHYQYATTSNTNGQADQLYAGDANTVRNGGITLSYNPRDAIFELTISRPNGLVNVPAFRFQDPAHRTAFGGLAHPQASVPNFTTLQGIQYLETGSGTGSPLSSTSPYRSARSDQSTYVVGDDGYSSTVQTLFYQKPGTKTNYVTYAGYVRNTISGALETPTGALTPRLRETYSFDRAAFVFGERTSTSAVPKTGSATFTGDMMASLVYNPDFDINLSSPTYLQWMEGTASTNINFATSVVSTRFDGLLLAPALDAYTSGIGGLPGGTAFHADGSGTIDLVGTGGFTGNFSSACFASTCTAGNALLIAGSSLDGAFFGPNGEEIGGGFRIVGGRPDQRIDILGVYTGKRP